MMTNKKITVFDFDLNVPNDYKPEWYKKGIEPYKVDVKRTEKNEGVFMPKQVNNRRGIGPIKNEDELDIKQAKQMESPIESMFFDSEDQPENYKNMIDDNENVNIDNIQKISVPNETFDSVENIRNKLFKKRKQNNKIPNVGDFIVIYNGKPIVIGDENDVREICEKIIIENEDLTDDDLMVYYRVSLGKFFG
jgi:hypothetical protein